MRPLVRSELLLGGKALPTGTRKRLAPRWKVCEVMLPQKVGFGEHRAAGGACVLLCGIVQRLVPPQMRRRPEPLLAPRAREPLGALVLVRPGVRGEMRCAEVRLPAVADVRPLAGVRARVLGEPRRLEVCLTAAGVGAGELALRAGRRPRGCTGERARRRLAWVP